MKLKNKIYVFAIFLFLIFLPGCTKGSFFEIQSVINPTELSENQKKITNTIKNYFGDDFKWERPLIDGKYVCGSEIINFDGANTFYVIFLSKPDEVYKTHIVFLNFKEENFEIFEDFIFNGKVDEFYIKDIDGDSIPEIIVSTKSKGDFYSSIYGYKYSNGHIKEVHIPKDFMNSLNNN